MKYFVALALLRGKLTDILANPDATLPDFALSQVHVQLRNCIHDVKGPAQLLRVVRNQDIIALLGTPKETAEFFLAHLRKGRFFALYARPHR